MHQLIGNAISGEPTIIVQRGERRDLRGYVMMKKKEKERLIEKRIGG